MLASEISKLFVSVSANTSEFQSKMQKVSGQMKKVGAVMTGVGAAITGTMLVTTKKWADAGDEVQKLALKTGFSTEALSELRHAAELSGADLSTVETGVKRMQKAISDAGDGMATYTRAFDKIGLSVEDLMGLSPEEQFEKITMAIAGLEDPTIKAAVAQDLLGRAGTSLLPMLNQGAAGIAAMKQEAHDLGIVFDQEAADKAAAFNDAITKLKGAFAGAAAGMAENLAPILVDFMEKVTKVIGKISAWTKEHPGLTKVITLAAAALGGLMMVLGPILMILPTLISALPILGAAFAALTGPIGIAIGAIAALIAIGVAVYKNWDKIKEFAVKIWNKITGVFKEHWDKILAILFPAIGLPILIARNWEKIVGFVRDIFTRVANWIKKPIETAINWVIDAINWLIEKLNKIPFVNIGNIANINWTGNLKEYQTGGIVPGPIGQPVPVIAHGGERFLGVNGSMAGVGGGGGINIVINVAGDILSEGQFIERVREAFLDIKSQNTSTGF